MILGVGVDIIEVDRIARAVDRWGDAFLRHVYCPEEIEYARRHKNPAVPLAARFAGKEAVYKAVGDSPFLGWKDILILNDAEGRPFCRLRRDIGPRRVLISLSHTRTHAVAGAVVTI